MIDMGTTNCNSNLIKQLSLFYNVKFVWAFTLSLHTQRIFLIKYLTARLKKKLTP